MKTRLSNTLLILGLVPTWAGLSGCTTVNTVEPAQAAGARQMISDKRVVTDATLNAKVDVVGINTDTTPGGLMRIRIDVLNRRNSVQHFNYRVEWFDMNAMPVETAGGGWQQREIIGKQTMSLVATAPNPNCKDFRIQLVESLR